MSLHINTGTVIGTQEKTRHTREEERNLRRFLSSPLLSSPLLSSPLLSSSLLCRKTSRNPSSNADQRILTSSFRPPLPHHTTPLHATPCVVHQEGGAIPVRRTGSVLCCTPRLLVEAADGGNPHKKGRMDLPRKLPQASASGLLRCYQLLRPPPAAGWLRKITKEKTKSREIMRAISGR